MTIEKLEYFYTIAKYNSISKASEELYVSKSTLSSSLKSLEEEIGDQLFDRSGKKLSLNQKGMQVFAEVTIILKKMKNINLNLSHNLINSTIRVGVGNPSILHKLNQGNKEFDLNFSEGNSFDLLSLLSYEKLDCVITSANVNSTVLKKELIGEISMLLCVSESVKQRILEDGISCLDDYQFLYMNNHIDHLEITKKIMEYLKLNSEIKCCYDSFFLANLIKKGEGVYVILSIRQPSISNLNKELKFITLKPKKKFYIYTNPLVHLFQYNEFLDFVKNIIL